jgi:hypothetical protein
MQVVMARVMRLVQQQQLRQPGAHKLLQLAHPLKPLYSESLSAQKGATNFKPRSLQWVEALAAQHLACEVDCDGAHIAMVHSAHCGAKDLLVGLLMHN